MNNGKICVSVCAETAEEMIAKIRKAEEFADVIEVRFDCLRRDQIERLKFEISNLKFQIPFLATFRSHEQGGNSDATLNERRTFWQMNQGKFWGGDFEVDVLNDSQGWTNRIVSNHDFDGVSSDLDLIYKRMAATEAEIIKIAVTANNIVDCLPVWKLFDFARIEGKQIIPIAMGDAGMWTRILGPAHGAFMTYASLETGNETAPGQITAKDLIETYRVKDLDENTQVFGVIGDPISQSLSTYMHNPAFAAASVNAVFIPFLVKDIGQFIARMVKPETREVELNFGGFSVTMPHKQSIIRHLDAIDPTAEKIGAVNTIKIEDGKLTGCNTDAHGFITPLKAKFGDLKGVRVAVFGAGGAARACVFALKQDGADVTVFARNPIKGNALADEFGVRFSEISNFKSEITNLGSEVPGFKSQISNLKSQITDQGSEFPGAEFDILVDTTPLGMKGALENDSLFIADQLDGLKFVYDLVTKPTDTPLIREAKKAGIPAIGGLEMLVAQGVKQFEIWTGLTAPVDMMREKVLERIRQIQK